MEIEVYKTARGRFLLTIGRLDIELDEEDANTLKTKLEMTDWLEGLLTLDEDELENFREDMLVLITSAKLEMWPREKGLATQFMRGEYTKATLKNILELGMKADIEATRRIADSYIK
ncbi:hypothetical protein DRN98_03320 [Methanosarcinales archaeon]|nr:MAG: hypothetical protein DRN98_03320 [Methanosarcinales archaeon]